MVRGDDQKGWLWRLPTIETQEWGKLGPGFGYGIGCGVGIGAGVVGGAGIGFGFPGLQFGVGLGAGCGLGVGFGYGLGKGRAYDENSRHSNIGKPGSKRPISNGANGAELGAIIDDFISGIKATFGGDDDGEKRRRR
eukprot:TRINITY_DN19227_c0_g1_i1.p1 TRINITY_DN19227_c0_g1~~TRINITY_DN19227_c0_g1_i1.p1  ORF type:complete len:137 (-),score=22.60 TRINITY_DN19227_c0_g1_i1:268-678(-)